MDWKDFWCCLNPRESGILTSCLLSWLLPPGYVEQTTFFSWWAAWSVSPTSELVSSFVQTYSLTPGIVTIPEIGDVPVYYFSDSVMGTLYAFSLTDGYICPEPCKILTFDQP